MIQTELWSAEGRRTKGSINPRVEEIEHLLDAIEDEGSVTFEYGSTDGAFTLLASFDGEHGVIEMMKDGLSFQARLPGLSTSEGGPRVSIMVGGQEGFFPANQALDRGRIVVAVSRLPMMDEIWEMFDWKSPGARGL